MWYLGTCSGSVKKKSYTLLRQNALTEEVRYDILQPIYNKCNIKERNYEYSINYGNINRNRYYK